MSKTMTCKELGGVCEQVFSGETLMDIMGKAMPHMGVDEAHKEHIAHLSETTGETKDQWMERMQQVFTDKPED